MNVQLLVGRVSSPQTLAKSRLAERVLSQLIYINSAPLYAPSNSISFRPPRMKSHQHLSIFVAHRTG
jgi:hypothetical protein